MTTRSPTAAASPMGVPAISPAAELDAYLRMIAGTSPGARLLEIRFALRHRDMGRVFLAAQSAVGAARLIRRVAARTDVYVGVALRTRAAGGRDAIDRSHLAFVEIDTPNALAQLADFPHPPSIVITSAVIRSRRVWACSPWGNAGWRHVVDRADGVDARGARTTYNMYDLSVGGFDRRGQTMLVADGGVDER